MQVHRLMLIPTGRYHDQVHRPYSVHTDPALQMQLTEVTRGGSMLEAPNLAGVAGQILRPAAQGHGQVVIANGWSEPRIRFLMEVHHPTMDGNVDIQYLTGYTDHVGVSLQTGAIDPNLRFYINNTITTRMVINQTHYGNVQGLRLQSASHVVGGTPPVSLSGFNNSTHTMRPEDVVGTISTIHDEYADLSLNLGTSFGAVGGSAQSHLKLSDRNHGLASRYMSKMFKGYRSGIQEASGGADMQELTNNIVGVVRDQSPTSDRFISSLIRRGFSLTENSWFTYGELCQACPETPHQTKLVRQREAERQITDFRQYSQEFTTPTNEVIVSTIISHSLPALMTELMLTEVAFLVTNQTLDGRPLFTPGGARSFANTDLTAFLQAFEQRFMVEVWRELTRDNAVDLTLEVEFSLVGNSIIKVTWQSRPQEIFVVPSFSDGLMTPIITNNYNNVRELATEFDVLTNMLSVDLSPQAYLPIEQETTSWQPSPLAGPQPTTLPVI